MIKISSSLLVAISVVLLFARFASNTNTYNIKDHPLPLVQSAPAPAAFPYIVNDSLRQAIDGVIQKNLNTSVTMLWHEQEKELPKYKAEEVLAVLETYDSLPYHNVHSACQSILAALYRIHAGDTAVRQAVAQRLLKVYVKDKDDKRLLQGATRILRNYQAQDFNSEARKIIHDKIRIAMPDAHVIMLVGIAEMHEEKERLKEIITEFAAFEKKNPAMGWHGEHGKVWHSKLVLARLGEKEYIDECVTYIGKVTFPDYIIKVLPQLDYIRQQESIRQLQVYLESDAVISPGHPVKNPNYKGMLIAAYTLSYIIKSVKGIPVEYNRHNIYSEETINTARQWMRNQNRFEIIR